MAAEALDSAGDGVWLAELAPVAEPELVDRTVAAVLQVREEPGRSMLDTLVDAVGDRSLLVLRHLREPSDPEKGNRNEDQV